MRSGPDGLTPLAPGARVLVTGARVTGRAVVAALASWDVRLWVCDDDAAMARALGDVQVVAPDDSLWAETSNEAEARRMVREGDKLYRQMVRKSERWEEVK